MSKGKKFLVAVLITLAVIALVVAIIVPRVIDVDRYRPEVIANIARGTGRSVEIGHLSLSVLPVLAIRADNIAIGNPPGFPEGHLLEIQRVYAEVDPRALLHRQVVLRSLEFEHPTVNLLATSDGRWNTEGPRRATVRPTAWSPGPAVSSQSVARVRFEHGRVTAANQLATGAVEPPSFEADDVAVELDDVNPAVLGLNLTPTGMPSRSALAPKLISMVSGGASTTWFHRALLQQSGTAPVTPPGALAAHGTVSAKSAELNKAQASDLKSDIELYAGGVMLRRFSMELAGGHVTGDFAWNSTAQPASFAAETELANIDLAQLLAGVPGANNKITGKLEGQLKLTGLNLPSADPLANKQGDGQIVVRNGTLPTLQLNRNLMDLMRNILRTRADSGDPSSFQSITADLEISGGEIHSRQITILGNGMDIDASGALALAGQGRLDYQGTSKIAPRHNGFEGIVAGLLGSKISADGKIHVPFTLTGTLDQPRFTLKNALFH